MEKIKLPENTNMSKKKYEHDNLAMINIRRTKIKILSI